MGMSGCLPDVANKTNWMMTVPSISIRGWLAAATSTSDVGCIITS